MSTQHNALYHLFHPKKIAIIGAKDDPGSVAATILKNLTIKEAPFKLFLINPKRKSIGDKPCYASICDIEEEMDLAIIVTPAPTVPKIVEECVKARVKSLIIISAGFKEVGLEGQQREVAIKTLLEGTGIRLIGPNCLGVMNTHWNMNATFAADMALQGKIAFVSQSGAMCTAVLDWSLEKKVGFSSFVSIGSMMDVEFGTLLDYFAQDPSTEVVVLYVESIGNAAHFMKAAQKLAKTKPIIMIKGGRTQAAAQACLSHTGSMAGSDAILDVALESIGVLRVYTIQELFNLILLLSKQPLLKGPNISVITNAGGPGIIATDSVISNHLNMTKLESSTIENLNKILPSSWSKGNPIDILGDAKADAYTHALEAANVDKNTDGILVILTPQDMTEPTATALHLAQKKLNKTVATSWIGGVKVSESKDLLSVSSIANFSYPDEAVHALGLQWKIAQLIHHPSPISVTKKDLKPHPKSQEVKAYLNRIASTGREVLTEIEAKDIIRMYEIPTIDMRLAKTENEALEHAKSIGFPIVLKLYSETITHKTDIGGVMLNLENEKAVLEAFKTIKENVETKAGAEHFQGVSVQPMIKMDGYEVIMGSTTDDQFGPVILFGSGGAYVEVYKDTALALPPLHKENAKTLIEKTKIHKLLKGYRGKNGIDFEKLYSILESFSHLLIDHPCIKECDINPLKVSAEGMLALDARIVLHPQDKTLPKPCLIG